MSNFQLPKDCPVSRYAKLVVIIVPLMKLNRISYNMWYMNAEE